MKNKILATAFVGLLSSGAHADEALAFVPTGENGTLETYEAVVVSWMDGSSSICQIKREELSYETGEYIVEVKLGGSQQSRIVSCVEQNMLEY